MAKSKSELFKEKTSGNKKEKLRFATNQSFSGLAAGEGFEYFFEKKLSDI